MNQDTKPADNRLPEPLETLLQRFVSTAKDCFKEDLVSMVLFGSGAEGRVRAGSDLNLLLILKRFQRERVDAFREPLRLAQVAARASAMFLLESELPAAAEAFAVKFEDITRRHRLLHGLDLVTGLNPSRAARKMRLRQELLNLTLRLRERYATTSLREEQLTGAIIDAAGPLRAAAGGLCSLEGIPSSSPRHALELLAASFSSPGCAELPHLISQARQERSLPQGTASTVMLQLIQLCEALQLRAETLPDHEPKSL